MKEMSTTHAPDVVQKRGNRRAWLATMLLFVAGIFSAADRTLPFLLLDPIKSSFSVGDVEMGLLTGFSFSFSLAIFALPLSWIADRYNRAKLIAFSIAIWCLATIACGFAQDFWTLFIFRMGVGFGEAGLQPAAYSLLADLFPSRKLPRALALMALSSVLGNVVGLAVGGQIFEYFSRVPLYLAEAGSGIEAWRATLMLFGAAGLFVAILALIVIKDPRSNAQPIGVDPVQRVSLPKYVRASAFFFLPFVGSMCAYLMYFEGMSAWTSPFFSRTFGWSVGEIGNAVGLVGLVSAVMGLPLGVWMNKRAGEATKREAPVLVIWVVLALSLPFVALAPLASTGTLALAGFGFVWMFAAAGSVIAPLVLTLTSPPHLRARMIAICNLVYRLAGALGPVIFGGFTDLVLGSSDRLYMTISILSLVLLAGSIPPLIYADRKYARVRELAERSNVSAMN